MTSQKMGEITITTCNTFVRAIKKRVEDGKTLDAIADELCDVKLPRRKIVSAIKGFLGEDYLKEHAETLGYNTEMANLARKRTSQQKVAAVTDGDNTLHQLKQENTCQDVATTTDSGIVAPRPEPSEELARVIEQIKPLIQQHGIDMIIVAIQFISQNNTTPTELKTLNSLLLYAGIQLKHSLFF